MNKIEIKNLTKYYGKILAISDVSFNIKKGEIFGFIGPNGAGKSTTIRAIMNLIDKSGTVLIDGVEFKKKNIELKKKIAYLPGEINLYDDLTVKDMLDYNEKFYENTHNKRMELVQRLQLDETKKIEELSLGNLKKLGIVLTIMQNAEILILDEPTNGLDPIMQEEFHRIILEEKKNGKTILYSSHILSEVAKICDRIAIIKEGKIVLVDTMQNLLENNLHVLTIESEEITEILKNLNCEVLEKRENYCKVQLKLECNKILKILSKYNINKILIEEPTLEEIVMNFYK